MLIAIVLLSVVVGQSFGKVYNRCELARELRDVHEMEEKDIATWVCIARHESEFNTSAVGHLNWDGSGDHGLFQISDLYWCSPPGNGISCGVSCAQLEDDDITDDVVCVKRIHRQHQRISGDGFSAWAVYRAHCSSNVDKYVEGCYDNATSVDDLDQSNELPKVESESTGEKKSDFTRIEQLPEKTAAVVAKEEEPAKSKSAVNSADVRTEDTKRARIHSHDEIFKTNSKANTKPFYAKLYEFFYEP